ncbi:glycosyltransferase [Streptomyces sp. IBSNAI002]|uniref:glycosyltransferase n=1 Tax=Streptomyces sp. IBSNAI002 TaxID=3457500 RepID=UPI003FD43C1F
MRAPAGTVPGRRAAPRPAYGELAVWALAAALIGGLGTWLLGPRGPATIIFHLCLLCFFVSGARTLTLVRAASSSAMKRAARRRPAPEARHSVTVIVPCHNEEAVVDRLVRSLLALDYPRKLLQLIIVDDGSTDATSDRLKTWEERHPGRLLVLRRPGGGGKSGALNHASRYATGDVIVVYDADHAPEPKALRYLAACFDDPNVGAAQGRCVIGNGRDSLLSRLVSIDYLGGYIVGEQGRSAYAGMPSYGGANCAVRHSVLRDIRGWNERSLTEDTDLTLRVMLAGHKVQYEPDALDYEEAVTTPRAYWRQRRRWATGHQQVCRDYLRPVLRYRGISLAQKTELVYYLLIYHLPLVNLAGLVLGLFVMAYPQDLVPISVALWPMLFYGPLIQLGAALIATRAPARHFLLLPLYFPLYVFGLLVVSKAWFDGVTGRAGGWAKTARAARKPQAAVDPAPGAGPDLPAPTQEPAYADEVPEPRDGEAYDRFPHARRGSLRGSRGGLASSSRWAPVGTVVLIAVGLVAYFLTKDPVRGFEGTASVRFAELIAPSLEAWVDGPGVFVRRDQDVGALLYLRITASCSVGPLFMAAAAIALSVRSIVRLPHLIAGLVACVVLVFCGNVLRISSLMLIARELPTRDVVVIHDSVAALFSLGFVLGGLVVLFLILRFGSRIRMAS